jgi:hypothetical protein
LAITDWKKSDATILAKEVFLMTLPESTHVKYDGELDTLQDRADAIKGLINKHSGEIVEVDGDAMGKWTLVYVGQSLTAYSTYPEQFLLHKDEKDKEPLAALTRYEVICLESEVKRFRGIHPKLTSGLKFRALMPERSEQRFRVVIPCKDTEDFIWIRTRKVISLGELFIFLSDKYNARGIYYLYLHLDIVATKRKVPKPKGKIEGGAKDAWKDAKNTWKDAWKDKGKK